METSTGISILPKDGEALYFPHFFNQEQSDYYFDTLLQEIAWKQEPVIMYGKKIMQPRLTAWYGEDGKPYSYAGITMTPHAFTPTLREISRQIGEIAGLQFTSVLLNQYRDGDDSVGWHRDNEKELGPDPVIGSVSFGAPRDFLFRHYTNKNLKESVELAHGSFLLMRGATQHCWMHSIPKRAKAGPRINCTFRVIVTDKQKNR